MYFLSDVIIEVHSSYYSCFQILALSCSVYKIWNNGQIWEFKVSKSPGGGAYTMQSPLVYLPPSFLILPYHPLHCNSPSDPLSPITFLHLSLTSSSFLCSPYPSQYSFHIGSSSYGSPSQNSELSQPFCLFVPPVLVTKSIA